MSYNYRTVMLAELNTRQRYIAKQIKLIGFGASKRCFLRRLAKPNAAHLDLSRATENIYR